jgi:hypothetical protein
VRSVVASLGDSITEGSPYRDSRRRAGDPAGQWQHWAALRHPGLEFRNFGICGERTDEIAARFDAAVEGADVLIVQGGINDIAQGRAIEPAAATLRRMAERGLALGLRVAACDVLPLALVGGATLLIGADAAARSVLHGVEIPVGIITALVGGPFLLLLLRARRAAW